MPSLWEGLPLTLLEAMSLAKPAVATPAAGIKDVIRDGKTGFLVPFKDSDSLGEKIIFLLKNPDVAKAMGEKAAKVCQSYDISNSVQRLSEIYRELVA
jgi:glycosyltransferase involved in cell wall biosynthesis